MFIIVCLVITKFLVGQVDRRMDSLKNEIVKLKLDVDKMQDNMFVAGDNIETGRDNILWGMVLGVLGSGIIATGLSLNDNKIDKSGVIATGLACNIGGIFCLITGINQIGKGGSNLKYEMKRKE